jgi:hypothetical protein
MKAMMLALANLAVLTIALSTNAQAQYEVSERSRFGMSLAFMRPSGSDFRDMGSTWLGPTIQVNATYDKMDRPNKIVSFTWYGQEGGAKRANFFPLTGTIIHRFGTDTENPWYVGGGAGVYFVNYKSIELIGTSYVSLSDNKMLPGVHYVVGREFSGFYAELRQDFVKSLDRDRGSTVKLSNWAISLGTRLAL